jgi:hypothetical protein
MQYAQAGIRHCQRHDRRIRVGAFALRFTLRGGGQGRQDDQKKESLNQALERLSPQGGSPQ